MHDRAPRTPSNEGRVVGSESDAAFHETMQPDADLVPRDQLEGHRAALRVRGLSEANIDAIYPRSDADSPR